MTREVVLDKCYGARTLPEIAEAWRARGMWLKAHPDDNEVFELGEMLSMLEKSYAKTASAEATVAVKAS
jgi:hypothetical protein